MEILLAYDVSDQWEKVKAGLLKKNYRDHWKGTSGTIYYLPDTTLYRPDAGSLSDGLADLRAVVGALPRVTVRRAVVTPCVDWAAVPGDPHEST
jgi:hypothetical protein